MKIGVIIVTYNAMPWHESCFAPIYDNEINGRVYIIDNGSTDGTQELIREKYPNFIFYQSESNLGFGKANNIGLKMALEDGCTHFLLLNQDASITWENIFSLVELQIKNPQYGVLSPVQMFDHENVDKLHLKSLMAKSNDYFNDLIAGRFKKIIYEIGYTNAAIWLISKDCLKKVGGFDPLFPHYGEDTEYAQRANYFRFKVGICPSIKGFHYRKQDIIRGSSISSNFISYLIDLKDYNKSLLVTYFRILLRLFFFPLRHRKSFRLSSLFRQWAAFYKVVINYWKIKLNKKLNLNCAYCFIDFSEKL